GFVCAGGDPHFSDRLRSLRVDDRVWAYVPGHGYVGVGYVIGPAETAATFALPVSGAGPRSVLVALGGLYANDRRHSGTSRCEYFVPVRWAETRPIEWAFWEPGLYANPTIVCRPESRRWADTVRRLMQVFPNF
ncbi:MAG TPA: hypothetical protein VH092_08560, partial [Urbifossiella sp.]|nr:hypothetical protein [Urbifossiella sp.]